MANPNQFLRPARFEFPDGDIPENNNPENDMNQQEFLAEFTRLQTIVNQLERRNNDNPFFLKNSDINSIPEFKGETNLLPQFIKICDQLNNSFFIRNEPNHIQNSRLLRGILSKIIKGQAQIQLGNFDYENWPQLKEKLTEFYGDRKTDRTLTI